ncbi:hypothetical protein [Lysinibacillus xylanilyticus]|uniref:hypothetical protein n=1 Tax=Lysinibacillus xylanilyticus TaxID=582475 RepID=UPI003816564E
MCGFIKRKFKDFKQYRDIRKLNKKHLDIKFNFTFVIITLVVALVVVPISFNFFFLWESGWSNGTTSDWFTLYGNIIGGLIGGFFTYLALLLTINDQKKSKQEEMRPRIDIPHQTIEFVYTNNDTSYNKQIMIELNNVGGSLAKNVECSISLSNFEQVIEELKSSNKIIIEEVQNIFADNRKGFNMIVIENGEKAYSLGTIYKKYNSEFQGNCMPLVLNHEAKTHYLLKKNVSRWLNYIIQQMYSLASRSVSNEINLNLEVRYSSIEYGDFCDTFKLEWEFNGIYGEGDNTKIIYLLRSTKINEKSEVA